jgi:hypothetical protein
MTEPTVLINGVQYVKASSQSIADTQVRNLLNVLRTLDCDLANLETEAREVLKEHAQDGLTINGVEQEGFLRATLFIRHNLFASLLKWHEIDITESES